MSGRVLVVGEHVGQRWELAWALHEAGIPAEQLSTLSQAKARLHHGNVVGVVVNDGAEPIVDQLVEALRPDGETGEVPFLLVASRATTPAAVVARVQSLLRAGAQASWSADPR